MFLGCGNTGGMLCESAKDNRSKHSDISYVSEILMPYVGQFIVACQNKIPLFVEGIQHHIFSHLFCI